MSKPNWYDNAKVSNGGGEMLTPGGHKCTIKQIEATKSKSGLDMYIVYFDTAKEDGQPFYYTERWKADTRPDRKWAGRMWLIVDDKATSTKGDAYGQTNFKTIMTSLEHSNEGFNIDWSADYRTDAFLNQFQNKKIGIVFRKEYYSDPDTHEAKASVKPMYFCSYDKALEQKVPKEKDAQEPTQSAPTWVPAQGASGANGFMQFSGDLEDEGLPFNV